MAVIPRLRPRPPKPSPRYYSDRRRFLQASAAAASASMSAETSGPSITKLHEPWQSRVFGYYDLLGECWNPAQFYARGLAKIRYFPAKKLPDGTLEEIEDGPAADALSMISHIAPDYGRLLFLIGEGRLCQSLPPDADPSDPVVWEFLSPTEVSLTNEGRTIQRDIGGSEKVEYVNISDDPEGAEPQPGEMRMWRFWRKHPRNSTRADSPVRPVIDLYEQLWWLTMRERAELQSRIADVGLMLIPEEIDFSPEGDAEEEAKDGDDPEVEPFQAYVGEMFMAAIRDPGTAPAAIPGVIRGPAEYLHPDFFRMLHIREGGESLQTSEREQAILQRLAVALDMPPAALTGIGTLNHWNAWKNEDEKWQHIEPVAELFATDIAAAYLRPLLIASGDSPAEAEATYVGYDNSEFLRDPDRGATAVTLNKQGLLSAEKTLEANGWSDDQDRMPDDEHLEWLAIQLKDKTIAGFEPDPAPVVAAPAGQDQPTDQQEQPPPGAQDGPDAAAQVVRARAVEYAVRRARAAAGSVARSARRSCPECFEGTNAVPSEDLIAALGPEKTGRVVNERRLVDAMAVAFVATLHDLGWNADPDQAVAYFEETIFSAAPWPVDWLVEVTANGDTG